jgi:hypothetical protein
MADYIPESGGEFDTFSKNIVYYVSMKTSGTPPAWGHIPPGAVVEAVIF